MDTNYDLTKKAGRGIAWNLAGQVIQQLIQAVVIVILARLLAPEDFGIFSMVMIFLNFSEPFRQWGFQAFLIQKENIDGEYEDTAFWSICVIAIFLFLFSVVLAPLIARFFNNPQLARFLIVGSLGFLLSPIGAVQWAQANKKLDFRAIMIRGTVSIFIYGICACFFAFKGFGVWSLVIAFIVKEFSFSVVFWMIYSWRPRLRFSYPKFKEMVGFSFNCMGSGVFNFFTSNMDNILVGKFLGAANLGLYNLAFNTVSQPETKLVNQITTVAFPAFSIIQHDKERVRDAYMQVFRMLLVVLVPILSVLFICAGDFVFVFFGEKWLLSVLPIRIMCLYGLLKCLTETTGSVFLSQGKTDVYMKLSLLRLILFIVFLSFGIHHGITGVAAAVLLYSVFIFHPIFFLCAKLLEVSTLKFYSIMARYSVLSLFMISIILIVRIALIRFFVNSPLLRLFLESSCGLLIYAVILRAFFKTDYNSFVNFVKKIIS